MVLFGIISLLLLPIGIILITSVWINLINRVYEIIALEMIVAGILGWILLEISSRIKS